MTVVLVTGGTGTLGRPTVAALRAAGHEVRVLSRRTGPDVHTGNLLSGHGVREALEGVAVVVHLATGRRDEAATATLVRQAEAAGVAHLLLMSIVGVDRIPMPYYRRKLASERLVAASSVPSTVLRATQFHELVTRLFTTQRWSPVLLAPGFALQPIAVAEVAERVTALAGQAPGGRADDIGGPQVLPGAELARQWAAATGRPRRVVAVRLPGRAFAACVAGHNLVPGPPYGRATFEEHLRRTS